MARLLCQAGTGFHWLPSRIDRSGSDRGRCQIYSRKASAVRSAG